MNNSPARSVSNCGCGEEMLQRMATDHHQSTLAIENKASRLVAMKARPCGSAVSAQTPAGNPAQANATSKGVVALRLSDWTVRDHGDTAEHREKGGEINNRPIQGMT